MSIQKFVIAAFCSALISSCASNKVDVKTEALTTDQAALTHRVSLAVENINNLSKDLEIWRKAVKEHTFAVIASGNTNFDQVKKIVCEQTASEELKARQYRRTLSESMAIIGFEASRDLSSSDSEVRKISEREVIESTIKADEVSFFKERDELIKECLIKANKNKP